MSLEESPFSSWPSSDLFHYMDAHELSEDDCYYVSEELYYALQWALTELSGGPVGAFNDKWNPNKPSVVYWNFKQVRISDADS